MLAGPGLRLPRVEDIEPPARLRARQYWPEVSAGLPLLVYFHGGRFFSGDLDTHDALYRSIAAGAGCRVLAVDYRPAPEHRFPCAIDDAESALGWAKDQNVPIGIAGDSAGANLAAGAAVRCPDAGLMCQVLIYPMLDPTCSIPSHREFATGYGRAARTCYAAGVSIWMKTPIRATPGCRRCLLTISAALLRR